jgi:anti-anti-sigma factor
MAEALTFHRDGDCMWVTPQTSHADLCLTPEMDALRGELDSSGIVRIVIDLSELPYFGSTLLDLLVVLWRRVARREGRLILYKPSAVGREVLSAARLDQLWPVAQTRDEAFQFVHAADVA